MRMFPNYSLQNQSFQDQTTAHLKLLLEFKICSTRWEITASKTHLELKK